MSTITTTPDPAPENPREPDAVATAIGLGALSGSTRSVAIGASAGFEVEHPEETETAEVNDPIFAASRLGATVRYTLSEHDVKVIVEQRIAQGTAAWKGNPPRAGQSYAALIVRDWADPALRAKLREAERNARLGVPTVADALTEEQYVKGASCNLQVFLDGNDTYWATSRSLYRPEYHTSTRGHFIDRWIGHNWPVD